MRNRREIMRLIGAASAAFGATSLRDAHATFSLRNLVEPKIEPEIIFKLHELPARGAGPVELLKSVEWVAHGFEIVQSHYPGWKPGCVDQMEQEDHSRLAADGGLAVARRQLTNTWRRDLGAAADALLRAIADADARAIARLVPAPAVRATGVAGWGRARHGPRATHRPLGYSPAPGRGRKRKGPVVHGGKADAGGPRRS